MSVKYRVLIDNKDAWSPYDESLAIYSTTLEANQDDVSTFEFSIDRTHALINDIHPRNSSIEILRNGASLFRGIVYSVSTNYDGSKDIKCKDELYFLSLTIMEPFQFGSTETGKKIIINADGDEQEVDNNTETHVSVADYLNHLIKCHNMHSDEKFTVGIVTATGDGVFSDSSYSNTWSLISSAMETYGFHVRVRHENGTRYIDFLKDITDENPQTIEFSKNLTDAKVERDASEMITAIIPTGASYETKQTVTNQYGDEVEQTINNVTTIESVNNGVKYIYDADAVAKYGWSWKRFEYNTTDPSILLAKAKEELTDSVKHTLNITLDGLDMGYTDKDVSFFEIGKLVHVICKPNQIDGKYLCKKMSINLINPSDFKIELTASSLVEGDAKTARATSNNSVVTDLASSQRLFQQSLDGSQEELVRRFINQDNEIGLIISNKTTKSEIIASINDVGQSEAKIKADKISLEGLTTINNGFSVDLNGNMTANNGTFNGNVYAQDGTFNGVVNARSGTFTGTIYAQGGTIGGFTITNDEETYPQYISLVSVSGSLGSALSIYYDGSKASGTRVLSGGVTTKSGNDQGYFRANQTVHSGATNTFTSGWDGSHWGLNCTTDIYITSTGTDKKVYTVNGPASTSDRKAKNIVDDGLDAYDFIMNLKPVKFTWKNGHKVHMGFIAQDVYDYLHKSGYDDYDIVNATHNNDSVDNVQDYDDKDLDWHMSYNDVIAPLVETVQRLSKEVERLKEEIKNG